MKLHLALALVLSCAAVSACSRGGGDDAKGTPPLADTAAADGDVLATVNGVAITRADVELKSRGASGHGKQPDAKRLKEIVQTLVRQEVLRQAAVAKGLDADAEFRASHQRMKAQLDDFDRTKLGELYLEREVDAKARPSEADARAYFEKYRSRMENELHVYQIVTRSQGMAEELLAELDGGASFEEVATKRLKKVPEGRKPWDVGFLKWKLVPQPWREAIYALEPGQHSKVISGPNSRFWILQLVETRPLEGVTFETMQPLIVEEISGQLATEHREKAVRELEAAAKIEYR